jgi:7,8-dihydropterin-6-yl-methyl-4-(beta-D-ribofuranosyl)aminobenzene 5'-phosphate synthase
LDDQAIVLNVKNKGLVVMTACGHSGIINTIKYAQKLTGVDQVYAVIGGFHTGLPGVPEKNADDTIAALKDVGPTVLAPMHCSGLRMIALALMEFPDQFLHNVVGTTLVV